MALNFDVEQGNNSRFFINTFQIESGPPENGEILVFNSTTNRLNWTKWGNWSNRLNRSDQLDQLEQQEQLE
jgi:hypothetical protein